MPIIENADPLEARLDPDSGYSAAMSKAAEQPGGEAEPAGEAGFTDNELVAFLNETKRLSRTYQQTAALSDWENAQSAYRSEHPAGSKYKKDQFKNRYQYFKPKTRAAVRKNLTATASALHSSSDVISVSAENDGDPKQQANAALLKEVIDHRFNSKVTKIGVPWFEVSLGARFDAQLMASCCSKQTWKYKTISKKVKVKKEQQVVVNGAALTDPMTGQPMMEQVEVEQTVKDVIEDRPDVALIPPELVLLDPGTSWINPAQNSPTLIVIWPMHIDDVKAMMDEEKNLTPWRKVTDDQLKGAIYSESELVSLKAAREGSGSTASQSRKGAGGTIKGSRNEIVEVRECFFRRNGCDYHCWQLRDTALLSDAVEVSKVYPAHRGTRPYIIGTDTLEPHVLYKQSHVRSWKMSQDEINDFSNLRMDATRQSVYPTAKVRAGRSIDYKAVQRRDGQGVILVREQDDVMWDRAPGPPPNVHEEVNLLSNDFDEIAGIFSQNSVQSNKQLNETVGGMQIISANANATSSFDLMCWVKTWVEPVLTQVVALEQYYEDDMNLLAIAGGKAKLFERFSKDGINQITDELLESEIQLSVAVGMGSADPMQKLLKFKTTFELAMPYLSMALKEGKGKLNYDQIFTEIFSTAGYSNGADRFITIDDKGGGNTPDPEELQKMMENMKGLEEENQQLKLKLTNKAQDIAVNSQTKNLEIANAHRAKMAEIAATAKGNYQLGLLNVMKDLLTEMEAMGQQNNTAAITQQIEGILNLLGHAKDVHIAEAGHANDAQIADATNAANVQMNQDTIAAQPDPGATA